ncbi:unnamed protein product, partial [Porites evermanni]
DHVVAEGPNNCEVVASAGQFDDDFALTGGKTAISSLEEGEMKEYQESAVKEKKTRKKEQNGKIIYISNSLKNSRITPTGEKTPEHALQKKNEVEDDRRHLLSTVATDYPYHVLQELFHCSSKTVTTA